jgi:Skp family chaperone for outer membrane proteins
MSEDVSKPYTRRTPEDIKNYQENWELIFGKKKRKLQRQLHEINSKRHQIIDGIQAKGGRTDRREEELESLKKKRVKIIRELDKLK